MRNHDEPILRRRRVDPRAPFPPLQQALGVVGPLLSNTRPAMLAGLLAGGTGTLLVKNKLHRKEK